MGATGGTEVGVNGTLSRRGESSSFRRWPPSEAWGSAAGSGDPPGLLLDG